MDSVDHALIERGVMALESIAESLKADVDPITDLKLENQELWAKVTQMFNKDAT